MKHSSNHQLPPSKKPFYILLGVAFLVMIFTSLVAREYLYDIEEFFGPSYETKESLFSGLLLFYVSFVFPWSIKGFRPGPKKEVIKSRYIKMVLVFFLSIIIIPFGFGELIFEFLTAFGLPPSLPLYILLGLGLLGALSQGFYAFFKKN